MIYEEIEAGDVGEIPYAGAYKVISPGGMTWYVNHRLHRTDGPACINNDGTKYWFLNGRRHRTDGPAGEYKNGDKVWCLKGIEYSEEEWEIEREPWIQQEIKNQIKEQII